MLTIRLLKLIIYPYWILNFTRKDRKKIKRFLIIYPYWILKKVMPHAAKIASILIIYPYWILNIRAVPMKTVKKLTYNLSILDFKFATAAERLKTLKPYNLSILDFKSQT